MLRVISLGSLNDFRSKYASGKGAELLAARSLSVTNIEHTLKLLSLCSLVEKEQAVSPDGFIVLSFEAIGRVLGSPAGDEGAQDVEFWVVEAVTSRLLDATINQFQSTVSVSRSSHITSLQSIASSTGVSKIRSQLTGLKSGLQNSINATASSQ